VEKYLKVSNWVNQNFPCLHNYELTHLQDTTPKLRGLAGSLYIKGQAGGYPFPIWKNLKKT
jgi:hypothetical protein